MQVKGSDLRNKLKATGVGMKEIAKKLDLTQQGLSFHLRKEKLTLDFIEKVKVLFPEILENKPNQIPNTDMKKIENYETIINVLTEKVRFLESQLAEYKSKAKNYAG